MPTRVGGSIVNGVLPRHIIIQIRLVLKNESKGFIFNLQDIYYLPNSPSNLISLSLLNDISIFYDNKHHNLYNKARKKSFAFG